MRHIVGITLFIFSIASFAEKPLCDRSVISNDNTHLTIQESMFNESGYQKSIQYLNMFPNEIKGNRYIYEDAADFKFWYSYTEAIKIIQGYNLRQAAINNPTEVSLKKFCDFINIRGLHSD